MKKFAYTVLLILLVIASLQGAVDMNMGTCVNSGDALDVKYVNHTPDPWDMRGWGMSIGATKANGLFAAQSAGGFYVAPNATAPINFAGCGSSKGTPYNKQLEAKTGSCNEPTAPQEPVAMKCAEINTTIPTFYKPDQCIQDGLGINRGDGYGGFIDSYRDQTQIQVTLPAATFQMGTQTVRFDPQASMGGPFYMMSMVALQEYLYVDMQFLMAMGASTSGAGLVDASGTTLYKSPLNVGLDDAAYGSFTVTYITAVGRLMKDYPKYFQNGALNINKLVSTGGVGPTTANSPQQLNSAFFASMNLWWLFDGLKAAQDLCFKQFLVEAKDKSAGLKLMLGGYHIGPNPVDAGTGALDDYATHILPTTRLEVLNAADATPYMKAFPWNAGPPAGPDYNTRNYITRVFSVVNQLVTANQTSTACGGAQNIYDAGITLGQVQELFYGQGGTAAVQGNGGLLWHFNIDAAARASLWTDLQCAFDQLKGKAPGRAANEISYRYDFLTVLRVARQYFGGYVNKFTDRPTPTDTYSSDYSIWVANHSRVPCTRSTQDAIWPVMALADTVYRKGDKLTGTFTDNKGIKEFAYTSDTKWRQWNTTDANFIIPTTLPDADSLWFRITDSCGNATIQQVKVQNLPPPPQLPKPKATPAGSNFFAAINVTVLDSVADADIFYTVNGSVPATTVGAGTLKFTPGTPIIISGATTTLKAIAVKSGWRTSEVMVETYSKVAMPVAETPKATPPGQEFSSLSAGISVTLATTTPTATIFYTLDGSVPDTMETATTKKYGVAILITTTTTIKAIAIRSAYLQSGLMTETYTRVPPPTVATPKASPPGQTFIQPLSVTLASLTAGATIFYTLDGTEPSGAVGGSTLLYTGSPLLVGKSLTLKALAIATGLLPSAIMTENYIYTPPVIIQKAWYMDLNGDGKIETVLIDFDKNLPALPTSMSFKITDPAGITHDRMASSTRNEIGYAGGSKSRLVVTLDAAFPFGVTSMSNSSTSGHIAEQTDIPVLDQTFPVEDSVPPVVAKAEVIEPDSSHPLKRIRIAISENVTLPLGTQTVFIFKHGTAEMASADIQINRTEKVGDRIFEIFIDSNSTLFPIVGDSVSLNNNGEVKDVALNSPIKRTFLRLDGTVPKPKPIDIFVTFPNSTKDKPTSGLEPQGNATFIPVEKAGNALTGSGSEGLCQGTCYTGENGRFVGPVFHIITPGPMRYSFKIFNTFGEFVAEGMGRISEQDLLSLQKTNGSSGIKYVARIVWTGHTSKQGKAGTGAYILQATMTTDQDPKTGAPPLTEVKRIVFGLLRGFRGT
jgi:hypothetical protein